MTLTILKCLFLIFGYIIKAKGEESLASVVLGSDGETLLLKPGYDSSQPMAAWGKFDDKINSTG